MRHKMVVLLLLLLLLVQHSHAWRREDGSFIRFCLNVGGQFAKQLHPTKTTFHTGDTCTVVWPVPAETEKEAEEYCQLWNMYPIAATKLTADGHPECKYENAYECHSRYTQIKGRCYRLLSEKFVPYEEAKKICAQEKVVSIRSGDLLTVEIVKMYEPELVRFFKAYFTDMRMFFIQNIPKMISNLKIEYNGDSDEYALAFGMAPVFRTGQGAVIRLPKNTWARVMCAYEPELTYVALSHYAKKLAPYYYPTGSNGQVWRTAGHYGVHNRGSDFVPADACRRLMKALGYRFGHGWDASMVNVQDLDDTFKKATVKSVLPYFFCKHYQEVDAAYMKYVSERGMCRDMMVVHEQNHPVRSHIYHTKQEVTYVILFYPQTVDGYHIVHGGPVDVKAPVFCDLEERYYATKFAKECEPGWGKVQGPFGYICHRVFLDVQVNFDDALAHCNRHDGTLSTFSSDEEYRFLIDLIGEDNDAGVWFGIRKKPDCTVPTQGKCSLKEIISLVDPQGVGWKTREAVARQWIPGEPNNMGYNEYCIHKYHLNHGHQPLLNDVNCDNLYAPACMKFPSVIQ